MTNFFKEFFKKNRDLHRNPWILFLGGMLIILGLALTIRYLEYFAIDITTFRIFGEMDGTNAYTSRLEIILLDFINQFSPNWLFGDLYTHVKNGFGGKYIHSLFLFSLTHLGVIGSLFLFTFIITHLYMIKIGSNKFLVGLNEYHSFSVYIFYAILFIALIGTSVFWSVLWFVFGFTSSYFE